jgi:hypothetical protein
MEKSRIRTASPSPIRSAALSHQGGQEQQPGADFEMGRFGTPQVNVEANSVIRNVEADHPAV